MDPDPSLCLIALDYYEEAKKKSRPVKVLLGLGCKRFESSKFEVFRAGSAKTFSPPEKRERLGSWEAGKLGLCVLCKNLLPPEAGDVGFTGDTGHGTQCAMWAVQVRADVSERSNGRATGTSASTKQQHNTKLLPPTEMHRAGAVMTPRWHFQSRLTKLTGSMGGGDITMYRRLAGWLAGVGGREIGAACDDFENRQVQKSHVKIRKILMTSDRAEGAMLRGILSQSEIGQWAEEAAELTLVNATLWAMFCHRRNCLTSQTHKFELMVAGNAFACVSFCSAAEHRQHFTSALVFSTDLQSTRVQLHLTLTVVARTLVIEKGLRAAIVTLVNAYSKRSLTWLIPRAALDRCRVVRTVAGSVRSSLLSEQDVHSEGTLQELPIEARAGLKRTVAPRRVAKRLPSSFILQELDWGP
ncbi:hypothetical protein BKA62DRAFT_676391 [Auriculariales sp. MPI-PUGE-AT-0066]|nr:hypothetical protein BKA62DRAFT_676391 [Auriculariales sp. MPI-PUGE-AT-0066]